MKSLPRTKMVTLACGHEVRVWVPRRGRIKTGGECLDCAQAKADIRHRKWVEDDRCTELWQEIAAALRAGRKGA